ncbi:MAG TPA: tetratricopeptide repeat protein [Candidatus Acidoferrum sp.]|nr:tetratricopeptide repeat protein [Candidatus Acidoferrum sp.]
MPVSDAVTIRIVDASALSVGSDFGTRYRIESVLGQGGMGRVYKAFDKQLDRIVAIKVVRQGMMGSDEALRRFKQELLLASKVSHKNILRIHDMGEVGEVKFISMAYVEGQDLHQILHDTPKLPFDRALNFARQLAEALAAAHAEGVVHRDLKPQNILVGKEDHLYVSDFGLAKSFEDDAGMTMTGAFMGTPRYMSPEQVEGNPADQRSDIYSYGLILYEMSTGDVPFTGDTTLKLMYQRIQQIPKNPKLINPELPEWFAAVVMRCLERDPGTRYQHANEILLDLQGQRSGAVPAGAARRVHIEIPSVVGKRWIWAVAGLLALVILAFAIPQTRHLILGKGAGEAVPSVSGIPSLTQGRFVAVLPFRVLGDEKALGYVAEGLNEALSAKLFQLQGLHLAPNSAVEKVSDKDPTEKVARALGSNLIITGMVQGSPDKMRIIVNLDDATSGKRTWSQEFSGVTKDLLSIEDQISAQLVTALAVNPSNEELAHAAERPTENVEAYDLYLHGRDSLRGHDSKSIESAMDFFNQALKKDPSFALAYTGIADASLRMQAIKKDSLWTQKALAAAQQAQQLNDKLPEVHSVLGTVYSSTGKYAEAISELKRALSLQPTSDDAYRRLGTAYLASGDGAHAIEAFQKAAELNPYFWMNQDALGSAYFRLGDYSRALQAFQQVTVLEPDIDAGYENIGNVYLQQGKYQECVPYLQKALQIEPNYATDSNLGTAYFFLKQYSNSADMFEKAVALNPNDTVTRVNLADAYRGAGNQDAARAAYQQAISLGYKELETNPRDANVMAEIALAYAKIGNAQEAMNSIHRALAIDHDNVDCMYTEAEIEAILGHTSDALKALRAALEKHYPADYAGGDPDLASLQGNPEFAELVRKYSAKKP